MAEARRAAYAVALDAAPAVGDAASSVSTNGLTSKFAALTMTPSGDPYAATSLGSVSFFATSGSTKKWTAGVMMSDRTIEITTPPITEIASGCNICDPAPNANDSGSIPASV